MQSNEHREFALRFPSGGDGQTRALVYVGDMISDLVAAVTLYSMLHDPRIEVTPEPKAKAGMKKPTEPLVDREITTDPVTDIEKGRSK